MGRSLYPTRQVRARSVRAGDVVLLRVPHAKNNRWFIVDSATPAFVGPPHVWSGRWAFGNDTDTWTTVRADEPRYVVKDPRDARRDRERVEQLRALRLGAQV